MRALFKAALAASLIATVTGIPVDSTSDPTLDPDSDASAGCKEVTFLLNGSAENKNLTGSLPIDTLDALRQAYESAPFLNVSGTQTIFGTFCKPTTRNANNGKLEMFFGSIVADRTDWSALGGIGSAFPAYKPNQYSWTQYANKQGYPTLAIDRLGNGKSSHPDALLVVQAKYEEALYSDLATQVRAGSAQLGQAYNHLIFIGNSYGSQLGTGIAQAYPKAYDELILTGFTRTVQKNLGGASLTLPLPAAQVYPDRFGSLPPTYLTMSSEVGRTNFFFGSKAQVDFEDAVAHLWYERQDVVSLGQLASVFTGVYDAPAFTGRVLDLTGEQDQVFCGPGSPVIGPAECGPQLKDAGALFPNADYNWQSVNRTGHGIQFHTSSQKVFAIAHQFLAGGSFKGGPPA